MVQVEWSAADAEHVVAYAPTDGQVAVGLPQQRGGCIIDPGLKPLGHVITQVVEERSAPDVARACPHQFDGLSVRQRPELVGEQLAHPLVVE